MENGVEMEIIGRLLDVSSLIATVVVALAVYRGTRTLARIQLQHEQRIAWMELDFHVLENDESLKAVDELLHPDDQNATMARRRKRWICYLLRNPLESTYLGVRAGLANCEATSMASLRASLTPLVHDELLMEMIERYTPDPAFVALCHKLRDEHPVQAAVTPKL